MGFMPRRVGLGLQPSRSSSTESPVTFLRSIKLDADGKHSPSSHSARVGGATRTDSASAALVVPEVSSHLLSCRIPHIVGETYPLSIGHTEYGKRHTGSVHRTPIRTVWERTEEALRERRLPTTKAYVAAFLGIKAPSIHDWMKPGGFPSMENASKLAAHLGVNTEWLLTERGPKRSLPQDAQAQKLWEYWSHLDEATKGELVGIAYGRLRRDKSA